MAKGKPRSYTILTIKRLYALSGNRCAFPDCETNFVTWESDTNFSNICHIADANPNTHKADRYDKNMSNDERADYPNLILLCPVHHIETNDPEKYSVEALKRMKRNHEEDVKNQVSRKNVLSKNPSILSLLINQIGSSLVDGFFDDVTKNAPNTNDKITFNNINRYKPIIEEYSAYQGKLNGIYEEIEKQGSSKKSFLLQNLRSFYLKEKGKYSDIESIKKNADNILESIENEIWKMLESSQNISLDLPIEAIKIGIQIVMVDAFMRCKILEEPTKHDYK
jgi:hypothetical protein